MMKNRSNWDITAAILKATQNGQLKTRIMYESRTSMEQLNGYLEMLIETEMIGQRRSEKRLYYYTTEKGMLFLTSYEQIWHIILRERTNKCSRQNTVPIIGVNDSPIRN